MVITFTIPVAKLVCGRVYAIDIEPEMLDIVESKIKNENLDNVEVKRRDLLVEGSGLGRESVDYVMLFNILHAKDSERHLLIDLLDESHRILRSDGRIGIIHWNYDSTTPRGPPMEMRLKPEQCIELGLTSGFKDKRQFDLNPHHYGIIMRK